MGRSPGSRIPTRNEIHIDECHTYIKQLEKLVKEIPDIYYDGAMDKGWGLSEDELDIKQEQYEIRINKILR